MQRVARQPEVNFDQRQSATQFAHLAAWRPVVDAVACGEQVGLALINRAVRSAFEAKRNPHENDAAACARLLRQDRDIRVLLSERGAIVGKPIDLPPLEVVAVEPVPPSERMGMTPALAKAAGAVRSFICRSRRIGEPYAEAKARLIDEQDAELIELLGILEQETEAGR